MFNKRSGVPEIQTRTFFVKTLFFAKDYYNKTVEWDVLEVRREITWMGKLKQI